MAKFKDIAAGNRAIRRVPLPLVNVRCPLLPDLPELAEQRERDQKDNPEAPVTEEVVGLRVLDPGEYAEVLTRAVAFATARGSKDPKVGDPIYDYALAVQTVLVAAVDPESDPKNPEPFFASEQQLLSATIIGRDGIIMLAEQQENWQDLCSPQALNLSPDQLFEWIGKVTEADGLLFFERLRPGMRWNLLRTMALLLSSSALGKSLFGSTSDTGSTSATRSAGAES